ncbi:MAG: MFS transporter [Phyllobacteriaceae bacterium]|nr:MFS transporter [Phyllobacteriaceae bacterium]
MIGWLWAVSVISEVALFFSARRLFAHWRPTSMLMLGGAVAIFRWIAMPAIGEAGFGAPGFFALAVTHAFTFSVSFAATQRLMAERVDEARIGAAQALMTFANGLFLALFTLAGGPLYRLFGAESFAAMSLAGAAGIVLAMLASRSAPEGGARRVHQRA